MYILINTLRSFAEENIQGKVVERKLEDMVLQIYPKKISNVKLRELQDSLPKGRYCFKCLLLFFLLLSIILDLQIIEFEPEHSLLRIRLKPERGEVSEEVQYFLNSIKQQWDFLVHGDANEIVPVWVSILQPTIQDKKV
jgi:hypothetical protein